MDVSAQLLFFFSALGAFNGLILAAYLFFADSKNTANRFLSLLLLMVSLRVGKSIFFYFSPSLAKTYLQIGLSACLLIGPFLYAYCQLVQGKSPHKNTNSFVHLGLWLATILVVGLTYPYEQNPKLWGDVFFKLINWIWLFYLALSTKFVIPLLNSKINKKQKFTQSEVLMISVYLGCAIIWLAYFTSSFTSYIAGALSFSFVLYLTILLVSFRLKKSSPVKYQDKKIAPSQAQQWQQSLNNLMEHQQPYCDPDLTLPQLAKYLKMTVPQLSQLLNDNLHKSFSHYINEQRINYAKQLLQDNPQDSIERISERSGYNSQSTFYTAFKKFEGTSPAKYRDQYSNSSS